MRCDKSFMRWFEVNGRLSPQVRTSAVVEVFLRPLRAFYQVFCDASEGFHAACNCIFVLARTGVTLSWIIFARGHGLPCAE
ncbi:hypothetical protein JOE68_002095 [Saccharothrix algeriensis]|uniref:Transposase n=1 Tax=Saccharothrix algeriensis TaxID=173560 RepID=A0ABS2S5I6_9PSEU|nr:hypothetical protein [Saccharothrix algeriensis]